MQKMQETGWDAHGIDLSPAAATVCRNRGLQMTHGDFGETHFDSGSFDVIIMHYLIEHVIFPMKVVAEAHRLLRSGGLLVLRWPNTNPILTVLNRLGLNPNLMDIPSHLQDFSVRTINRMLKENGFDQIETTTGGWTAPSEFSARCISMIAGISSTLVERATLGRILLPGVSRTTIARCA